MKSKSNIFFSTVTFKDGIIDPIVLTKLKAMLAHKRYQCYIMVEETGAYGKNNHYHIYCEFNGAARRTDNFTRKIRSFYPVGSTTNRYTVKTMIEKDKIYRVGYYIQKEADYKVVISKNVDLVEYAKQYKDRETTAAKLIIRKNKQSYRLNELPSVYLAYCDANKLDKLDFPTNYQLMAKEGMISLNQANSIKNLTIWIKMLLGSPMPTGMVYHDYDSPFA